MQRASAVVVLDAPRGTIRIDLARVRVQRKSLLEIAGVIHVPPGLHRLEVHDGDRPAVAWLKVEPGKLLVKGWDAGLLVDPDPFRTAQVQGLAAEEGLEKHLTAYPTAANALWPAIVAPIVALPQPPSLRDKDPAGHPSPLEAALLGTHGGRATGLLAELAQAFIVGFIDEEEAAQDRWRRLAAAIYGVREDVLGKYPELFGPAVELLVAQQQLLPVELSPEAATPGEARRLAVALARSSEPALADAGKKLTAHLDQRGVK